MSVKRLLVGLGLEACSESATQYALEIADRTGAELTGIALIDTPGLSHVGPTPIGGGAYAKELSIERTAAAQQLTARLAKRFRQACTAQRVRFDMRFEEGDPLGCLIAIARYHDLAIVGRDGLCEHGLLDEPHDGLVRLVAAGVRPMVVAPPDHRPIRRVLVAYSGSMESAKTLRQFVQLRLWPDAELIITHFDKNPSDGQQLLANAQHYCRSHGVEAAVELRQGTPRHALLPLAEELRADMLVLGNSARQLLVRRLFGETALQAVRESELPLFLCQ